MGRVVRSVVLALGCLIALVVATAATWVAYTYGVLIGAPAPGGLYQYLRPDWVIILLCASLVAGAVFALFLLSLRLPRTLLIILGLASLAMAVVVEYLSRQPDYPGFIGGGQESLIHGAPPAGATLTYVWLRDTAPTVAGVLLAVAVILVAVTRGTARSADPTLYGTAYDTPTAADPYRPASVLGGVFALLGGALVWVAVGLAQVTVAAADGSALPDFFGQPTRVEAVSFGSFVVLYVTAAAAAVLGGAVYTMLLSRRLHGSIPIIIGIAYAGATIWYLALAQARTGVAGDPPAGPASKLLAAVELGAQVPVTGAGLLLAVPLIVAGVRRLRQHRETRLLPALVATPMTNDPTLPLY